MSSLASGIRSSISCASSHAATTPFEWPQTLDSPFAPFDKPRDMWYH
jgi:hypothetical protein